jgi:hypothetical protein
MKETALPSPAKAAPGPSPRRRRWSRIAALACFGVPVVYLATVLALQPADHLGPPTLKGPGGTEIRLERLLYDDFDMAAIALRGLNASLGRTPGRTGADGKPSEPAQIWYFDFNDRLDEPPRPLSDRFFLEYPPTLLPLFELPWLRGPGVAAVPPVVLEARQHDIVWHEPRQGSEVVLWTRFRQAVQTYMVLMIGGLLALIAVLRRGYQPGESCAGSAWLLALPAAMYFALNRFDVVPTLFVALSLAALGRQRLTASAVLLGFATMLKVFPGLIAILVLRYLSGDRRQVVRWGAAYAGTVAVLALAPAVAYDFDKQATLGPYLFQLSREAEVEYGWTFYSHTDLESAEHIRDRAAYRIFPESWAVPGREGGLTRAGLMLALLAVLSYHRPASLDGLLRRGAIVLIVFVAIQIFYSPQWILWFTPFLVPLAARQRSVLVLAALLDLVTFLTFPLAFDFTSTYPCLDAFWQGFLVDARFLLMAGLVGVLAWSEWDGAKATRVPTFRGLASAGPTKV